MMTCSICSNKQRSKIEKEIVGGTSMRRIAARFSVSASAVVRHKNKCLAGQIERAEKVIRTSHPKPVKDTAQERRNAVSLIQERDAEALDVHAELRRIFLRLNKMADACDAWLSDPDDPTVYDLNPRAHEVKVTYEFEDGQDRNGNPIMKRKKDTLAALIRQVERGGIGEVTMAESKISDPRQLIINTANALKPSIELLAKLVGQLDDAQKVQIQINAIEIAR